MPKKMRLRDTAAVVKLVDTIPSPENIKNDLSIALGKAVVSLKDRVSFDNQDIKAILDCYKALQILNAEEEKQLNKEMLQQLTDDQLLELFDQVHKKLEGDTDEENHTK